MIDQTVFNNKKAAYYTLGCKLNFAETSTIGKLLAEQGVRKVRPGEKADICVVNTCSVTELADKKCRQAIRRISKQHPGAFIVVTGCYAQLKPEEVSHIEGVDLVLGAEQKLEILQYLENLEKKEHGGTVIASQSKDIRSFSPSCSADDRTRHFLKVQDGCDYYCSYCTIPFARGRSRNGTIASMVEQAQEVALLHFGNKIYIRGLIEISNCCRNNCYYCGIRKGNPNIERYRLSRESILNCCKQGYELGFRTFVLQGGEDPALTNDQIEMTVARIRQEYPDCAITLSLGEKSREAYERFFRAGANRYLLRHETYNELHYRQLHPAEMSGKRRLQCLADLKEIGYQTGTGIMVGSPGQTVEHIIEDLLFIEKLRPEMIGIGPFLPHHDTPFAEYPSGTAEQTILLLSIFRLMHPSALIPATTALATLIPDGRERGILAGANVVMPNLSPREERRKYELYNDKASLGAESAEGLAALQKQLKTIGYEISTERGDFKYTTENI